MYVYSKSDGNIEWFNVYNNLTKLEVFTMFKNKQLDKKYITINNNYISVGFINYDGHKFKPGKKYYLATDTCINKGCMEIKIVFDEYDSIATMYKNPIEKIPTYIVNELGCKILDTDTESIDDDTLHQEYNEEPVIGPYVSDSESEYMYEMPIDEDLEEAGKDLTDTLANRVDKNTNQDSSKGQIKKAIN